MLKCPGSTVEIAILSAEPRNGNLHLWQVSEMPLPHARAGHALRFHLPRCFWPETAGELLLMPWCLEEACLHRRRPAELHVCQELLHPSLQPHRPRGPLSILSFLPLSPCLGTDPYLYTPQVSYSFTSLDLSSPVCKLKHPGFSILGDPRGKSCISIRKPIGRYSFIPASLLSPSFTPGMHCGLWGPLVP